MYIYTVGYVNRYYRRCVLNYIHVYMIIIIPTASRANTINPFIECLKGLSTILLSDNTLPILCVHYMLDITETV